MKIEVGIYEKQNTGLRYKADNHAVGWKILCEQEKVPHRIIEEPVCPVIIFDGETPNWLADFMADGGIAILSDCRPGSLPFQVEFCGDASVEYVDLNDIGGAVARVQCVTALYQGEGSGKIQVHENRITKLGVTPDEFPVFLYQSYGKGGCWYTGLPVAKLVEALGDTLRKSSDYSEYTERITSVDKHILLRAMRSILIRAFHQRNLPYVHLWYYPHQYQSVFSFRIDVDGVYGDSLARLSMAAKKQGIPLTIFVNKSLCQNDGDQILQIDPMHQIGNHADIHNLFSDYSSNYQNILSCKNWLDQLGVMNGPWFAAPRGMWNYNLHQALEDLGYLFTSDFGQCIEGYPFYPYIANIRSKLIQIPVNPFSAERASVWKVESGKSLLTPEEVISFWTATIKNNYENNTPIILYSHPEKFSPMADAVFESLQQKLNGLNLWITTLPAFAEWWIERDQITFTVDYSPDNGQIIPLEIQDKRFSIRVL